MQHVFDLVMDGLALTGDKIAVAVSGGGDSMALALLTKEWADRHGFSVHAFTVDHGLRSGSGAEALQVGKILQARGIAHQVLNWQGEKPKTHVQERARAARYDLLLAACRAQGIETLAVAHNAQDQAETFWMRLAHGSGLDGLCGMATSRDMPDVRMIRPLLKCTREDLRAYCTAQGVDWVEDPSNENEKFLRVRLRGFEDLLAREGLDSARLLRTMHKLGDAQEALEFYAARAFTAAVTMHAEGYASIDPVFFKTLPRDIARRVLARVLQTLAPADYPPAFERLDALCAAIVNDTLTGETFYGCEVLVSGAKIIVCRELAAIGPPSLLQDGMVWDGRFAVHGAARGYIGALGEAGLAILRENTKNGFVLPENNILSPRIKKTLPALWQGEKLLYVPHLSWNGAAGENALQKPPEVRFLGLNIV